MSAPDINPYDRVAYPSRAYPYCHPDRLCVIGRLFGLETPDTRQARVLEIGCGGGGNLVPMAGRLPASEFVGVDLSARAIEEAGARIRRFGLTNVAVQQRDILELGPDLGPFDYILCHGVFSWVPDPVREALFVAIRQLLTATGVAYVSYNAYPGWHLHGVARDIMLFHGGRFETPEEQVEQARAFVRFAARTAGQGEGAWSRAVRQAGSIMDGFVPGYYFHDFLATENTPFLLSEFVRRARTHGLNYLGDALLGTMLSQHLPDEVRAVLDTVAQDIVTYEQYMDLLRGTGFRRTLLCHGEAELRRRISGGVTAGMYAVVQARLKQADLDPVHPAPLEFETSDGSEVTIADPLTKAAMVELLAAHPAEIAMPELVERARLTVAPDGSMAPAAALDNLGSSMIQAFAADVVEILPRARQPVGTVTDRPLADAYAQALAADGEDSTPNLRHEMVNLTRFDRELLGLCDGAHSHPEIVAGLAAASLAGRLRVTIDDVEQTEPGTVHEAIEAALPGQLRRLLREGLLVG